MASKKLAGTGRKAKPDEAAVAKKEATKPVKRAAVAKKNKGEAKPVVYVKVHNEPDAKTTKRKRVADDEDDAAARRAKTTKTEASIQRKQVKPVAKKPVKKEKPAIEELAILNKAPTQLVAVFSFGSGECGELGLGPKRTTALVPKLNPTLDPNEASKHHIVDLACGGMHTIALTADNKILTWGVNDEGALGRDTAWEGGLKDMDAESDSGDADSEADGELNPYECVPTEVSAKNFPKGTVFTQVAAGDSCSFVLTQTGTVYGWGAFRDNKGDKRFTKTQNGKTIEVQNDPILIPELQNITQIVCGANHVLALDKSGQVWGWGSYEQNQLGQQPFGRYQQETLLPRRVRVCTRPIKYIASGEYHSFAVDRNDNVWAWGLNSFGEAGYIKEAGGNNCVLPYPMKIRDLCGKGVTTIAGGSHHSGAVTKDGEVFMWGRLDGGQLGIEFSQKQLDNEDLIRRDEYNKPRICLRPTAVPDVGNVVHVACGTDHTIFINDQGVGYATGFGSVGQLGLGNDDDANTAQRIRGKDIKGRKLVGAAAGGQFSIVTSTSAVPKTE